MKTLAVAVGALLASSFASVTHAQVLTSCTPGVTSDAVILGICGLQVGVLVTSVHVVCIDDFQYQPQVLMLHQGDTVAWVNVESACTVPPGSVSGCNSHHEIVTAPDQPGVTGDTLDTPAPGLCSPIPGTPGLLGEANLGPGGSAACLAGETNVFCHKFSLVGSQHYTCFINPGHQALLHGGINVESSPYGY